jgi:septal ring factor EnvC (AmiA/AmiB activator)
MIKSFLLKNYKTILKVLLGVFVLYWVIYVLTPNITMSKDEKSKIDSLNNIIKEIYKEQQKLDSNIDSYNKKIDVVDDDINKIKGQKTIVKEIYHEEINRAGNYTEPQLDSFFSARYHY